MDRKILLDLETTGLDPKKGDRILEIAMIEIFGVADLGKEFSCLVNPEREIPKVATSIHNISNGDVVNAKKFYEICDEVLKFIDNCSIIAHNASFDMKFLNYELSILDKKMVSSDRIIDTLQMANYLYPRKPNNLDALCKRFGIDLSLRTTHGALIDTRLLAGVYKKLIIEYNKINDKKERKISYNVVDFPLRQVRLKEDEYAKHRDFIYENIEDSLWYNKQE